MMGKARQPEAQRMSLRISKGILLFIQGARVKV